VVAGMAAKVMDMVVKAMVMDTGMVVISDQIH
jgi:hypothetical protein